MLKNRFAYIFISIAFAHFCPGQTSAPASPKNEVEALVAQLQSPDLATQKAAVQRIRAVFAADPTNTAGVLQRQWLRPMIANHLDDDAADLAMQGIIAVPSSTPTVESLLAFRVRAELDSGKATDALADAKSLFNVSTMQGTGNAILLVSEALGLANPGHPEVGQKFRAEQLLGSDTKTPHASSTVLASIKVNAKDFEKALPASTPDDYYPLVARENLLLMADRADEAKAAADEAYTLADNRLLPAATENLARCIKAKDGTIGGANQFVLSLRPSTQPSKN